MADKYDAMIDAVTSASGPKRDKYDDMIDAVTSAVGTGLEVAALGGQTISEGLQGTAAWAAKAGPIGGVIGVPALMAEQLVPKTKTDVALLAVGGPALEGLGAVGGKALAPVAAKITPQLKRIWQIAQEKGIPLTAADISNSQVVASLESFLAKTPLGSGVMKDFRDRQISILKDARDRLLQKFGPSLETYQVGLNIKELIKDASIKSSELADDAYTQMRSIAPPGLKIKMGQLATKAQELLDKELLLPPNSRSTEYMGFLQDFVPKPAAKVASTLLGPTGKPLPASPGPLVTPELGFEQWDAVRSNLGKLIADSDAAVKAGIGGQKFLSSKEAGVYKKLRSALEDDLAQAVKQPGVGDLKAAHDLATEVYKKGKETFSDPIIRRVSTTNPELVVGMVFKPNATSEIRAVRAAIGEQQFGTIRQKFAEKLLGEAGTDITPTAFYRSMGKYGEETLGQVFSKKELEEFKALSDIGRKFLTAEKLAGNVSGTARNMITAANGALVVHNPVAGVATLLAPPALAKLYLSSAGRRYLTEGLALPAGTPAANAWTARLAGYLGAKKAEE